MKWGQGLPGHVRARLVNTAMKLGKMVIPKPSAEDLKLTERMVRAGRVVGIRVIDHVIVGREGYRSLKEMDRL